MYVFLRIKLIIKLQFLVNTSNIYGDSDRNNLKRQMKLRPKRRIFQDLSRYKSGNKLISNARTLGKLRSLNLAFSNIYHRHHPTNRHWKMQDAVYYVVAMIM